jgi:hypothetical protein
MLLGEFARSGLPKACVDLRRNGVTSWNAPTAGMHIHVSRDAFEKAHAYKFCRFVYGNKDALQRLAGRKSRQWASFDIADHHQWAHDHGMNGSTRSERYLAINAQNANTLELRFWRGSLQFDTIQAALECCDAMHVYTNSALNIKDAMEGRVGFDRFVSWLSEDDAYPTLRKRIAERINIDPELADV